MNVRNFLNKKLNYTIAHTQSKFREILDKYEDKIIFHQKTEKFDPIQCKKIFSIDGLNTHEPYVHNAYKGLTEKTVVELELNNTAKTNITFYHKNDFDTIIKCIKRIYCMINIFGNKDNIKIYDGMTIDILLYNAPRIMTNCYKHNPKEINTIGKKCYFNCVCGYASIDNDKFKLCVTRKNGCLGLLVHELGHICELDLGRYRDGKYHFPNTRLTGWQKMVKEYFDIQSTCHIGSMTEGINNGNSSIIHAMFTAIERKNDHPRMMPIDIYRYYYEKEFVYAIEMVGKLLRWFKYNSLGELFIRRNMKYTQNSLLLEYILIRCIYLIHFDELGLFKQGDRQKDIDDKIYTIKFLKKMFGTIKILDVIQKYTKNNNPVRMEYYYYA